MARIRTIKPEFWSDVTLMECSLNARLLFIGTWNFADDFGNIERSAKQMKARVFPGDNVDCEPLLCELISHGLLIEYESEGKIYLHIQGFTKHQVINRKGKPQCPPYHPSLKRHGTLTEYSVSTHDGMEGNGREWKEGNKPKLQHQQQTAARDEFDKADAALRSIPGIQDHPVYADPVIAPIWTLIQQGLDLKTQIVPSIKAQLAKRPKGRLVKGWGYFVPGILDSVNGAAPTQPTVPDDKWKSRLETARRKRMWDRKWGPMPPEPGCQVPAHLLSADDGKGWSIWQPEVAA